MDGSKAEPGREHTMGPQLSPADQKTLLRIARRAIEEAVRYGREWQPEEAELSPPLRKPGASFVTLHTRGQLHGCIGSVISARPLAVDVAANAVGAALRDPRFPPLTPAELPHTAIEISVLGPVQRVEYESWEELLEKIRPGVDGVLMRRGWHRGLLLPQVWEQITSPEEFLAHVALKAGFSPEVYQQPDTEVYVFQVQKFGEPAPAASTVRVKERV